MADIAQKLAEIRGATVGLEIRETIASGIEAMNTETINNTAKQTSLELSQEALKTQGDEILSNVTAVSPNNAELVASHTSLVTGENSPTIGARLDKNDLTLASVATQVSSSQKGLLDVSAYIQNLLNTHEELFIPLGTYNVTNLHTGICKKIWGYGILKSIGDAPIFTADLSDIKFESITLQGSGNVSSTLEQGINVTGKNNVNCDKVTFLNFKGNSGFYITGIFTPHRGSLLRKCIFHDNKIGLNADTRGEFTNISQCVFYTNTIALRIVAGNVTVMNCEINENVDGIHLLGGDNDSHGKIIGCNINHNTDYALYIDGILQGEIIANNNIYEGVICCKNTTRPIRFNNNTLDSISVLGENCKLIYLTDNYFPCDYLQTINMKYNGVQSTCITSNNKYELTDMSVIRNFFNGGYLYLTKTQNQNLVANTENLLTANVAMNATSFNQVDTVNMFYNAGIITKKLVMTPTKVNINLKISKLSTDTAEGWYILLKVNGVGRYLPITRYDNTMFIVATTIDLAMDIGNSFGIYIFAPAGVTSNVNFSEFFIEVLNL